MAIPRAQPAPDPEFQALVRAKYAGDPGALADLGARLLVGREAPRAPIDGAALLTEAAAQGERSAYAYIAVSAAAGVGRAQNWGDAFDAIGRAAALGEPDASRQIDLLRGMGLAAAGAMRAWLAASAGETLRESPRLVSHPAFLTPAVCEWLKARAAPKLVAARVNDAKGGGLKLDPMRTNRGAVFSLIETDLVMQVVRARIAHVAGVASSALEPAEVLHYRVGETYKRHVDFFHPALPNFAEEMRARGQRVKTCLVYLNDDFDGGETEFPKLGIRFRGGIGGALLFENVGANGAGNMDTLHTGLPPTRGEKWLLSQWMRSKPQQAQ
jgi:hypothetical protein